MRFLSLPADIGLSDIFLTTAAYAYFVIHEIEELSFPETIVRLTGFAGEDHSLYFPNFYPMIEPKLGEIRKLFDSDLFEEAKRITSWREFLNEVASGEEVVTDSSLAPSEVPTSGVVDEWIRGIGCASFGDCVSLKDLYQIFRLQPNKHHSRVESDIVTLCASLEWLNIPTGFESALAHSNQFLSHDPNAYITPPAPHPDLLNSSAHPVVVLWSLSKLLNANMMMFDTWNLPFLCTMMLLSIPVEVSVALEAVKRVVCVSNAGILNVMVRWGVLDIVIRAVSESSFLEDYENGISFSLLSLENSWSDGGWLFSSNTSTDSDSSSVSLSIESRTPSSPYTSTVFTSAPSDTTRLMNCLNRNRAGSWEPIGVHTIIECAECHRDNHIECVCAEDPSTSTNSLLLTYREAT
ncbi:hypothetical protein BLNAU_16466 [Blattamonas nauphoetae]|uniref:Uncharacterized protein n=1 Tax=Blattamonas nauphoetae TaxID=2049346 RepID=A0ABQ9XD36_9EUKA|nr:hypothetical protein BLNAU_16466 [Blattamonas nauphoetae]